jgi:putative inorganic carbon (hco3(-)) transporter
LKARETFRFYLLNALFLGILSAGLLYESYWVLGVPVVLLLGYYSLYSVDKLLLLITFFTPFAINYRNPELGTAVSMPTEPLMFLVTMPFLLRVIYPGALEKKAFLHPVSLAVLANLLWMLLTTVTSEQLLVSLKFLLARLWFVVPFYFLGTQLFRSRLNIKRFIWLYVISLGGVIAYTWGRHLHYGISERTAHWVMTPFYNDHTAYAAVIAMYIPVMIALALDKRDSLLSRSSAVLFSLILLLAMVLSYTRAAWLSLVVALAVLVVLLLRIRFRTLVLIGIPLLVLGYSLRTQLIMKLEKNKQDSSSDYAAHLQSITNISTDASNLERINRWNSALRMFRERPVLGWGPGTYIFQYAPFQNSREMTIISTNMGNAGNAHSEYIGPLAESGVGGMLTFVLILVLVSIRSIRLINDPSKKEFRTLLIGVFLGLLTYFVHGGLNNFLDTDKASVPFWGFIAIIVAIDLYHGKTPSEPAAADK